MATIKNKSVLPEKFSRRDGEKFEDWLLRMLWIAYLDARKCKRNTKDQYMFEVNAAENLVRLRDDILERRYEPGRGIAFVIRDPVMREIFAAPFRDRIVHHVLYNLSYDWWDKRMIFDSYSCRLDKGVLLGAQRLRKMENQAINEYHEPIYIVKMDIRGYFMSLPRKELFERVLWGLNRQYPHNKPREYYLLKFLWRKVIFDDPTEGVRKRGSDKEWEKLPDSKSLFCQRPGTGIVIGNLSSQLLSNIYLDQLDRFIKYTLKYKYYGRYVDDFFILTPESRLKQTMRDCEVIKYYLQGMKLHLHPKKFYVQNINRGVVYLGVRVYPNRMIPGPRVVRRYKRATKLVTAGLKDDSTILSYIGHFSHLKSDRIQQKIFDNAGWDWKWWKNT